MAIPTNIASLLKQNLDGTIFTDVEALNKRAYDPFAPLVVIRPVSGFPKTVGDDSNTPGTDIVLPIKDRLQNFAFKDNEKKVDELTLTFIDDNGTFVDPNYLVHGSVIDVAWGYKGNMSEPRRVIVLRLKIGMVQGRKWARRRRGYLVTLDCGAYALSQHTISNASYSIQHGQDFFANKTLTQIVTTIGDKMGYATSARGPQSLTLEIPPDRDAVGLETRAAGQTYPQFLKYIAARYGMRFFINGKGMYFGVRPEQRVPAITVDMNGTDLLGFELDGDLKLVTPAGLSVIGFKPSTHTEVTTRATVESLNLKKGQVLPPATTQAEAKATVNDGTQEQGDDTGASSGGGGTDSGTPAASFNNVEDVQVVTTTSKQTVESSIILNNPGRSTQSALRTFQTIREDWRPSTIAGSLSAMIQGFHEKKKHAWKLHIRIVGNPKVNASQLIQLVNFETPLLDGVWEIKEVNHDIENTYITQIKCHRLVGRKAVKGNSIEVDTVKKVEDTKTKKEKAANAQDLDGDGDVEGGLILNNVPTIIPGTAANPTKKALVAAPVVTHSYKPKK